MSQFGVSKMEGEERRAQEEEVFDGSEVPPFRMAEIRASIPTHCWVKNPWRSLSYVLRDVSVVILLMASAIYVDSWVYFPLYCAAQGTMFWALFVLGHDCGHGSFSDIPWMNSVVGHVLHSSILVPYHAWRISHRTHHQNHGNVEKDETWVPMSENIYRKMDSTSRALRFTVPIPLFAFPLYLWRRSPGKSGSHFNPYSKLFLPGERRAVLTSSLCCLGVGLLLSWFTLFGVGALQMLKLYWTPYAIFVVWLDFVTYMHHHGHEGKLPWYRGKEWSYLRGGLTTVDLDYGLFNGVHHDIGTHVVHHLFPQIPHYHLVEATEGAKGVIGKYYREPEQSGPFPFHLLRILLKSIGRDHFVSDDGDIVFYQTDAANHRIFSRLLRLKHLQATTLIPNIFMRLVCCLKTKKA